MRRSDLERYLDRGNTFGFHMETDDARYLGWILVQKLKPHDRYLALLEPGEDPVFVEREERIRKSPYLVLVLELDREVHESDRYETEQDYRKKEQYWFGNLDEVDAFLSRYGKKLSNILWAADLDSP
jgi:hypothetical protein